MPGREPLSSIVNFEALQAETERVIGLVRSIQEAIDGIGKANSLFKNAKGAVEQKAATDGLIESNEQLLKVQKQLEAEQQKSLTLETSLAKQLAIKREINKQAAVDMRAEAKEAAGLNDAYRKLEIQYNQAARAAKNIGVEQGVNSEAYKKASAEALKLSEALKKLDADQGQHQRNVGNYSGALRTLENSLNQAKGKMDALTKAGQQNTQQGKALQEEIQLLGQLVGQQANGFTSLSREIMATGKALETMAESGMQGTEAFRALEEQYVNARRELNEFRKSQQLLTSEAPMLKSLTIAAKGLGGVYAAGAGTAALFADGNEKVEKELNKLVAIMTVLQGLNELHELVEKKGAIATIFSTAAIKLKNFVMTGSTEGIKQNTAATIENAEAEEVAATATTATTTAMKALRIALISTGIGALLVLLPVVAEAMMRVAEATKQAKIEEEAEKEVKDKMVDSYAKERVELDLTVAQLKDEKISRAEKTKLIKELQDKYPDYLHNIENEGKLTTQLSEAIKDKLIPALELEAKAKAAQELAGEKYKELLELQNKKIGETASMWQKARIVFGTAIGEFIDGYKIANDAFDDAADKRKKDINDLTDQIDALFKISLSADEQLSHIGKGSFTKPKDFTDYEEGFRAIREELAKFHQEAFNIDIDPYIKALRELHERYQEAFIKINDVRDRDLKKVDENEKKGIITIRQAAKERLIIEQDTNQARLQAEAAYYANLNALQEKERERAAAARKAQTERDFKDALESQKRIAKQLEQEADAHFREQVTIAKNNQAAHPSFGNDKALAAAERDEAMRNQQKLLDEKKITQQEFDSDMLAIQADYNKKVDEALSKEVAKYANAGKQIFDIVGQFEKAAEQRKIQSIERQEARMNQMYERERQNIEGSTLSEQQKQAALNTIAKQQAVRDKQMQMEKVAAERKQAKFDKDKALFDIAANTAIAVTRDLGDIPKMVFDISMGAAQAAIVLSKPLPAFAQGTENAPQGWGIWGESGQEAKIDRRGRVELSTGPSLTRFEGGERIIPHDELNRILEHNMLQSTILILPTKRDDAASEIKRQSRIIEQQTQELKRSLKDQRVNVRVKGLPPGWDAYIRKAAKE